MAHQEHGRVIFFNPHAHIVATVDTITGTTKGVHFLDNAYNQGCCVFIVQNDEEGEKMIEDFVTMMKDFTERWSPGVLQVLPRKEKGDSNAQD